MLSSYGNDPVPQIEVIIRTTVVPAKQNSFTADIVM
jgi:hypothetical protein